MKHSSIRVWGIVIFLMFISSMFFSACENEVHINADYKETIVVYALLDPEDTIQYIKVNKAYLNEGIGALEAAKISDSLYLDSTRVAGHQAAATVDTGIAARGAMTNTPVVLRDAPPNNSLPADDAAIPAIKRSESPGSTTPTSNPVSINKIARIPMKPKEEIRVSGWSE